MKADTNWSRMKTDTYLHGRLKLVTQQTWHGVRLRGETCHFFCKFSKVDLFDLKPNCAHPCQESIEMVWLWLFVT